MKLRGKQTQQRCNLILGVLYFSLFIYIYSYKGWMTVKKKWYKKAVDRQKKWYKKAVD